MDALQHMGRGDIGHIEGRVLTHEHDLRVRQFVAARWSEREMIAALVAHRQWAHAGHQVGFAQRKITRAIVQQCMPAQLRFEGQRERGIARNIDPLDRIHLYCDGKAHPRAFN